MAFELTLRLMAITTDVSLACTACLFAWKLFETSQTHPIQTAAFFSIFVFTYAAMNKLLNAAMPGEVSKFIDSLLYRSQNEHERKLN